MAEANKPGSSPSADQPDLTDAPANGAVPPTPIKPATVLDFSATVVGADGIEVQIGIRNAAWNGLPGAATQAQAFTAALIKAGYKPAERHAPVVQGAAGAPAASGEAIKIEEPGKPPRCSLHGPMKWIEGTYKEGHARAGQKYEFWACSVKGCKPKEQKSA